MREQLAGGSRVFSRDEWDVSKNLDRSEGDVFEVADRGCDEEQGGHDKHSIINRPNSLAAMFLLAA
jgi:hypothetical protein